ncbi:hypothetical protein OUZ56_006132 [Daphnia magna]|uniref:Protein kinase domain-containing protein n=1 Tax=Daphnia magna TaxID=35525 RepID=A0ABQ9YUR0_9CRUS|nr:hypothetical protein OUZ56_006132 [Daphnia magna]
MAEAEQLKSKLLLLFNGKKLVCNNQRLNPYVDGMYGGYWKRMEYPWKPLEPGKKWEMIEVEQKEATIRRIKNEDCLDGWKDVADKLIIFDHNNILRVYSYEEDVANGWRYFALEPYSATLYEYCNGKYKGAMPNESQVLYQITNGVSYLHGEGIVHGDLNPLNVVIAAQSRPVRMKISNFKLSKYSYSKQLSEIEPISSKVKLCLRKYWTLSEETDSLEGIEDATEDVIAAGCILFYYITRGKHLFGNDFESILINLEEKNPVNLEDLGKNHFAYEPIKNMINPPGKGFNWLHIANEKFKKVLPLQVNTSKLLGSGTFAQVFEGKFNGDLVAVKQMTTTTAQKEIIQREMNTHIELNHVNVVKLLDVADSADNSFMNLVLELCGGTLMDYCQKKYSGPELPPDELVLYQIANGLHYIHSRGFVHRNIKPENILISMTTPVQMKVSGLSFVKKTRDDIFSQSKIRGTLQWLAPERLKVLIDTEKKSTDLPDGTIKSDTFSSGCVFFYFLTRGKHPFGKNQATVPANILKNKPEELNNYNKYLAADDVNGRILAGLIKLIEDMIQFKEEERIGLPEVLKQLAAVSDGMVSTSCKKMAEAEQPKSEQDLLFNGEKLVCNNQLFNPYVDGMYGGYWRRMENPRNSLDPGKESEMIEVKKKEATIRRIKNEDCLDGWKGVADKLVKDNLNNTTHNNILRVFWYEEANGWRYFALEPYSATLYEYCTGQYKGAMPNQSQVLYQITNGIFYLHGQEIVHGDLNPLNVVIAAQSRPVRIKISDFGLSKFSYSKQLSQKKKEGEKPFEMELCLRKYWYWTMSEKTYYLVGIEDSTEDVIAAGCILFYYLTRGKHLFGNDFESILKNLKEKKPVNLENLGKNHFAYEPIKNMINPPGKGFNWLHQANEKFKKALSLQVNTGKELGKGSFGQVFEGKFNGDPVAVKQMTTTTAQKEYIQREMSTHTELNHVNVVKVLDVADSADNSFTHLVLELCCGTLTDYYEKKYNGPELPPDELVLYQIANGLHYIHSRNLVHRDIKPENILISMTTPVQMKVSDLSFVKKTRDDIFSQSKIRGTLQWMAPERLKVLIDTENKSTDLPDGTIKSDTFSSGCVFFYFLTRGKHPFGKNHAIIPANILENKQEEIVSYKQNLVADDVNGRIPAGLIKLIEDMIQFKEEERIGLPEVMKQLAAVLYGMDKSKYQLSLVEASLGEYDRISSHPTEPILACANEEKLIFYTAENLAIPFSNWRKKKEVSISFQHLNFEELGELEWNIHGTQLAAGFSDDTLVVWSYPECEILFQKKLPHFIDKINWNPTRPNLFAAYDVDKNHVSVCDSSIGDVITTIDVIYVLAVKWISENRIAVSSFFGKIEIFEIVENNLTTTRLVKEYTLGMSCRHLEWNERTQYLASGGDYQINIWSMDDDMPIYSLKLAVQKEEVEKRVINFVWRLCTGNGEEESGIEMARKSAKNFTFAYCWMGGVFIWNPLENGQQPRPLFKETYIETVAFSSDGRFLAAVSLGTSRLSMIWSAEDWVQIYKVITDMKYGPMNISFFTTKSTNLYENKLIVNYEYEGSSLFEFAFEESNISDSASEIPTESAEDDIDLK